MSFHTIVAGGGIAGSAVALALARAGRRVLIVERERAYRDRIRGEGLHSWGLRDAEQLGVRELLYKTCAHALPAWDTHVAGVLVARRDLPSTTRAGCESVGFHHPEMQQALLDAAQAAGAEVMRDARVVSVRAGREPEVRFDDGRAAGASLVVVADGRSSPLRGELGVPTERAPQGLRISGVLLQGATPPLDAVSVFLPPTFGLAALLFPQPRGRVRLYLASHPAIDERTYAGDHELPALLERCIELGVPQSWLADAQAVGPLGTFDGTPLSAAPVELQGVVLVGDAAGCLDPAFGSGMSLALRDARSLSDLVIDSDHPQAAIKVFVLQRHDYYERLLRLEAWMTRLLYETGPAADSKRFTGLGRLAELGIDVVGAGPDSNLDDETERALFA
jgi:2-polyprenyl-6-methoxyphenol hydroxylase-like FAD-dependent oxidoreductase